jgi:hypothetical protein
MTKTELQRLGEEEGRYYARSVALSTGVGLGVGLILMGVLLLTAPGLRFVRGSDYTVVHTRLGWIDVGLPVVTAMLGGIVGLLVARVRKKKNW